MRRRRGKKSNYGVRLDEKQKLRYFYGVIREKQFRKYFQQAKKVHGNIGNAFLTLLERRLDVVVYRMNFLPTIFAARQFVSHGHIRVNGKKVDVASYMLKEGDKITLSEKGKSMGAVAEYLADPERDTPDYVTFDAKALEGEYVRLPVRDEISYPFTLNESLIVEYYSR
jgi:small subunit ribosomal protein S4